MGFEYKLTTTEKPHQLIKNIERACFVFSAKDVWKKMLPTLEEIDRILKEFDNSEGK